MKLSPIVVFAYNRPHYLKQTLEALESNAESKESTLYIFCDGPKPNATGADMDKVLEVRALAKERKWCKEVIIIEKQDNSGLAKAIINGVTEILSKHDSVIILEDDLVTSPFFLKYMNTALNKYRDNDNVISVVGYNYPILYDDSFPETFFLKTADCLGWGTWKQEWALFEHDASVLVKKLESSNSIAEFNFDNNYPYFKMLKNVVTGKVNSWAIRWYASAFVNNKYTLFPKKSLVRHIGNNGTNVKADNSDIFGWDISLNEVTYYEEVVEENKLARKLLAQHFKKYNRRRLTIANIKYLYKRFILSKFSNNKSKR